MAITRRNLLYSLLAGGITSILPDNADAKKSTRINWKNLDSGLDFAQAHIGKRSTYGDSKISILRIDPNKYSLDLLMGSHLKNSRGQVISKTADEWAKDHNLTAVINAGMFEPDGRATGYMRNSEGASNPNLRKGYNVAFAFNPVKGSRLPEAQIIDLRAQNFNELAPQYKAISQSIRMMSLKGNNTWSQQRKYWSNAAVGMSKNGEVYFLHARSPFSVHDFVDKLRALPLKMRNLMYLEGGPEASLYVKSGNFKLEGIGSYETGFNENDDNHQFWPIPNIFGIRKK